MHPATLKVINEARADIGMGEYPPNSNRNPIVTWYNEKVAKIGAGPWCAMSVSHWSYEGDAKEIITAHALVDSYVRDAVTHTKGMTWHWRVDGIRPGDFPVYDWSLPSHPDTRSLTEGDHIGLCEAVGRTQGTFYAIEGNYGDRCQRLLRDGKFVLGYCRPNWAALPGDLTPAPKRVPYPGHQHWIEGRDDHHVYQIQTKLKQLGFYKGKVDSHFGPLTKSAVLAFQKAKKLERDGFVGVNTWRALNIYSR